MFEYPNIDPVITTVFGLPIYWYGAMYLLAFVLARILGSFLCRRRGAIMSSAQLDDFLFYGALGVIIGGRLGYVLFYILLNNPAAIIADPWLLFKINDGGMSFHGGLLGVITAMYFYAKLALKCSFWQLADFIAPIVPTGLMLGRIGNFINGELWGKATDAGFIFAVKHQGVWKHPSMLYQAALEGLLLFIIVWIYNLKPRKTGSVSALFLFGYALARFGVEFVRLPDEHIGYLAFGWLTMGHVLTLPMLAAGIVIYILAQKNQLGAAKCSNT